MIRYVQRRPIKHFPFHHRDSVYHAMVNFFESRGVNYVDQITEDLLAECVVLCKSLPGVGKITRQQIDERATMDWVRQVVSWEEEDWSEENDASRLERVHTRVDELRAMGFIVDLKRDESWRAVEVRGEK